MTLQVNDTIGQVQTGGIEHQWRVIFERLQRELGDKLAVRWLGKITPEKVENGQVCLFVPSKCIGELVEQNYAEQILSLWRTYNPDVAKLNFKLKQMGADLKEAACRVSTHVAKTDIAPIGAVKLPALQTVKTDDLADTVTYLNPAFTFDSFVVGKPNEFAYAAARRVADDKEAAFNPLYLHSSVGLGKTHLMQAIAWRMKEVMPEKSVMYVSSEQFVHRFIKALRSNATATFRDMFRSVDVLMIDDVQFICGKKATQEEFFHTFNDLIAQGKKIILSSDSSPSDLKGIEDRLKTRLAQGLVADIHPTTYELRLAILEEKVAQMGKLVDRGILEFLAKNIATNVRELEGALKRIVAHADLVGARIDMETTKKVLADVLGACERTLTVPEIQAGVAAYFHLDLKELKGTRRDRRIARPRQIAMYLSKTMTTLSLPDIANQFDRDHSTVIHAVGTVEGLLKTDTQMPIYVKTIKALLQEG